MKRRAALAIGLACMTAPLASASNAGAEETVVASPSVRPYRLEPILGLDPVSAASRLSATPRFAPLRPAAPRNIVSSEEKTLIIVAAAIVGVVLVVAVFAH